MLHGSPWGHKKADTAWQLNSNSNGTSKLRNSAKELIYLLFRRNQIDDLMVKHEQDIGQTERQMMVLKAKFCQELI